MANKMDVNEIINGRFGYVYDENGRELDTTQEFEAKLEFEKQEIKLPGKFLTSHKVTGGKASGNIKALKKDSTLAVKIASNPTAKYNYIGKLKDPTAKGEEAILLIGVSFDSSPLMGFKSGELAETDVDFTFDDYRYLKTIPA